MNQQGLELSELINKVKLGLENAKYSDLCINGFVPIWNHLTDYLTRNGETSPGIISREAFTALFPALQSNSLTTIRNKSSLYTGFPGSRRYPDYRNLCPN
jgi:hypothetical protein